MSLVSYRPAWVSDESWKEAAKEIVGMLKIYSCGFSSAGGVLVTAITRNPWPMIVGVSDCWQKVIAMPMRRQEENQPPVLVHPIPDYQMRWYKVNYQFPNNTFMDPEGERLDYYATLVSGNPLPRGLKFSNETRTFTGDQHYPISIRVTARDPQGGEAFSDFEMMNINRGIAIFCLLFAGLFLWFCYTPIKDRVTKCKRRSSGQERLLEDGSIN